MDMLHIPIGTADWSDWMPRKGNLLALSLLFSTWLMVGGVQQEKAPTDLLKTQLNAFKHMQTLAGRGGSVVVQQMPAWRPFVATWYDGQEGINGTGLGITKSGARVQDGITIAVDPMVIKLGSTVLVKFQDGSTHVYKAEDTGGAIIGNRIDIYNDSLQQCLNNGRQAVQVMILERGHNGG